MTVQIDRTIETCARDGDVEIGRSSLIPEHAWRLISSKQVIRTISLIEVNTSSLSLKKSYIDLVVTLNV